MKTIIEIVLIFYFAFPQILKSQGTTAVPFLLIGPSPQLGGSAGANAVLPTEDAFGFYYNPAQLGNFSQYNNFSFHFYPKRVEWLPQFNFDDLFLEVLLWGLGIKFPIMKIIT